ncbi:MAG: 30S ribosomal protein S12 methylthiotransferase RimO [Candidatus Omnitrophota bacterium]|nr:30S ribosomal protein S12 methylthiotransferase RimO [Candidatus Omnitrophota bacterium]MDZ4242941.1 30S ribosomal protein S12 methylthiotransferase RimO [Candidatus Omnitrophota bacterium]
MIRPAEEDVLKKKGIRTTLDFLNERIYAGQKIGMVNLGCARNLVDSQTILGKLKKDGHAIVDMDRADVAIVNTCAFIEDAKKESIDAILDLIELKKQGKIKRVVVAGCLAQRYGKELAAEIDGIDAILGVQKLDRQAVPDSVSLTPKHFAYVKICESCYNRCSFCAIPGIKGKFVSRTIESVLTEVKRLDEAGAQEINIIGQDITAYGMDIYREKSLARLLKEIIPVTKNIQWVRLLYAFPAHVTDELIDVMAREEKICKYIDMPLQHISDPLLSSMNRGITTQGTRDLIRKLRRQMPQGILRTTFIVGLPGETDRDFNELMDFVREERFERVGVFVYSREEGTPAFDMPGQVPDRVKRSRMDELMREQQKIAQDLHQKFVGRTLRVLIEEKQKGDGRVFFGRSEYDAPDVDGVVYVHAPRDLSPGDFVTARITDAYEYDLVGETA